jgi:formiminoglutamase
MKNYFQIYQANDLQKHIKIRSGETKLGEKVQIGNVEGKYVFIGIPESMGVKANHGIGGTETLWEAFLSAFLSIQSTKNLVGNEISILGYFNFPPNTSIETIDNEVSSLIFEMVSKNKIPIIIGGGHNNAFPILKGVSTAKKQAINAINLDAHSDFRQKEARHSGNGFRYAMNDGFLKKYAIVGLHENYNAQNIIDELSENPNIDFSFYEDIFIREKISFKDAISQAIYFTSEGLTGIELDLDCIENTLSSAMTPCGITPLQARQYLYQVSQNVEVAYLHIVEGATKLENGWANPLTGKLVSYLVSDFMKGLLA